MPNPKGCRAYERLEAMSQYVQVPCEDCGHHGTASLGQAVVSGRLLWSRSILCPKGCAIEEDGDGFPPEWFRAVLLEDGGLWEVHAAGVDRVALLKAIRDLFGLSMEESLDKGRMFPLLFQGTRTEAEWLREKLSWMQVASEVRTAA